MERTYTYYTVNDDEYEYTVEDNELKDAIVDELFYCYFNENERLFFSADQIVVIKKALKNYTDDNDNWEDLADDFESDLKEVFRDDAYEEYKNREEI